MDVVTKDGEVVSGTPRGVFFRTPFNYDTNLASDESGLACLDESLADQSQEEEANINTIVRRFNLTGQLPTDLRVPQYGDFTEVKDFRGAMEAVRQASETFMELPADVRMRFDNDPQKFLEFCGAVDEKGNLENIDEMRKLGLAVPKVEVVESAPMKVEVVNPAPPVSQPK